MKLPDHQASSDEFRFQSSLHPVDDTGGLIRREIRKQYKNGLVVRFLSGYSVQLQKPFAVPGCDSSYFRLRSPGAPDKLSAKRGLVVATSQRKDIPILHGPIRDAVGIGRFVPNPQLPETESNGIGRSPAVHLAQSRLR